MRRKKEVAGDAQLRHKALGTDHAPENKTGESVCWKRKGSRFSLQENGVTCLFTYAAVGGTNEVSVYLPTALLYWYIHTSYFYSVVLGMEYISKENRED